MDIKTFSQGLQKKMTEIDTSSDDLIMMGKALSTMRAILTELKQFTVHYKFETDQEEILFFKDIKPTMLSQYYYYKYKFEILLFDSFRDRKSRMENYISTMRKLQKFATRHQAFYEYCLSCATHLDRQYFTRHTAHHIPIGQDETFSTLYDVRLAKILSHILLKDFITRNIRLLENSTKDFSHHQLQWTNSKVALVELIYALQAIGAFNYGKTSTKQIVNAFEEMFAIDIGNYARVFSEICIRKSGQTNFLDQLKEKLKESTPN